MSNGSASWLAAGWLSVITPFFIGVFYAVITIWILAYLVKALTGNLSSLADPATFSAFIQSNELFYYLLGVAIIVYAILASGVKEGIERGAKIMMPALFVLLVLLVIFVSDLGTMPLRVLATTLCPTSAKLMVG